MSDSDRGGGVARLVVATRRQQARPRTGKGVYHLAHGRYILPRRDQFAKHGRPSRIHPPLPHLNQFRKHPPRQRLLLGRKIVKHRIGVPLQRLLNPPSLDIFGQRQIHRLAHGRLLSLKQIPQGKTHQRQRPRLPLHIRHNAGDEGGVNLCPHLQCGQGNRLGQILRFHPPHQHKLLVEQFPQSGVAGAMGDKIGAQGEEDGQSAPFGFGRMGQQLNKRGLLRLIFGLGKHFLELVYQQDQALAGVIGQQNFHLLVQRVRIFHPFVAQTIGRTRHLGQPFDGYGQTLEGMVAGEHGRQQPLVAFGQPPSAEGVEQPRPCHRGFAAPRRPRNGDEVALLQTAEEVVYQALTAEEKFGIALLEGGQAEVGNTAVPHGRLFGRLQLNDQRGHFFDGEAILVTPHKIAVYLHINVTACLKIGGWVAGFVAHDCHFPDYGWWMGGL